MAAKKVCPFCRRMKDDTHENFARYNWERWAESTSSEVCIACLTERLDPEDFAQVDNLMRYLNLPYIIDLWLKLVEVNGKDTLPLYLRMIDDGSGYEHKIIDWKLYNEKWREAIEKGELEMEVPILLEQWMAAMRLKWQGEYALDEYKFLENLYENMQKSQHVVPGLSESLSLILCKKLLTIHQKIERGEPTKDEINEVKSIMNTGGFEAKGTRNVSAFESAGELFHWLARKGFKPNFYDGEIRDEADLIIRDTQAFTQRLVLNEPGIVDQVRSRQEAFIAAKGLEDDVFLSGKNFDAYEQENLEGGFNAELVQDEEEEEDFIIEEEDMYGSDE